MASKADQTASQRMRSRKLEPTAASTALIASPALWARSVRPMRCSALRWPITGSTAARRRKARLMAAVSPRFWPATPETLLCRRMVALVAGIGHQPIELGPDHRLEGRDHARERVSIIRIAGQRLDVRHELPTPAAVQGGGHTHLDAELKGFVGLALADAFHLGRVQRIDLLAPFALALVLDGPGQCQRPGESLCELGAGGILRARSRITRPSIVRRRR